MCIAIPSGIDLNGKNLYFGLSRKCKNSHVFNLEMCTSVILFSHAISPDQLQSVCHYKIFLNSINI